MKYSVSVTLNTSAQKHQKDLHSITQAKKLLSSLTLSVLTRSPGMPIINHCMCAQVKFKTPQNFCLKTPDLPHHVLI